MILYFSATGNSKHVAERLAEATGDSIASIPEYADEKRNCVDLEGGMLGIVCPVFFGGLPRLVENYLEDLVARDASYVYFVGTYGGYSGQAGLYAKYLLARNGIKLDARFGVKMPGTFSPGYRVDDAEKNARRNAAAEEQIEMVAQAVCAHARGDLMSDELPLFVADAMHAAYAPVSRTRFFSPSTRPASAVGSAPRNARTMPSRCVTADRSGSRTIATSAWAACTAARRSPSPSPGSARETGIISIPTRRSRSRRSLAGASASHAGGPPARGT